MKSTARSRTKRSSKDDRLDLVFGALSDRTRRALLDRLEHSPAMITELAERFPMSLPAVSKHVRVLERAGLVKRTIDGRVHRCELDTAPLDDARQWIDRYRAFWSDNLDALADYVESGRPR
jgi:DNA-binding transcriptional ArsR family regulator